MALASLMALAAAGCGERTVARGADAGVSSQGDLVTSAADGSPPTRDGARPAPDSAPAADSAPSVDASALADSAAKDSGVDSLPADVVPQSDDPGHGVISGVVWIDPQSCPRVQCGNGAGDDCRGRVYVTLRRGVHDTPVRAFVLDVDLRGANKVPFRFTGLTPGSKYIIGGHLVEQGTLSTVAPAPVDGDVTRSYRSVIVPPAGYERRHDVALTYRRGAKAIYPGTMKLSFEIGLPKGATCIPGDVENDCRGFVQVMVMNYSQNKVQSVVVSPGAVDLSGGKTITLTLPDKLTSYDWPRTLFVTLIEWGSYDPSKPPAWNKINYRHYESPFFVDPVCTDITRTLELTLRR